MIAAIQVVEIWNRSIQSTGAMSFISRVSAPFLVIAVVVEFDRDLLAGKNIPVGIPSRQLLLYSDIVKAAVPRQAATTHIAYSIKIANKLG